MKKVTYLACLIFFLPLIALAAKVPGLYTAEVPVISQSSDVRTKAARQGLAQVLMRISGDPEIENNVYVQDSLKRADYFVEAYSYTTSADASSYLLKIQFSHFDVNKLLKTAGIVSWSENRPLVLIWLALKKNQAIEIVGDETAVNLMNNIKQQANRYGLPVIFPMMDVAEVDDISAPDVAALKLPLVKKVSGRYGADALLLGSIAPDGKAFESKWMLTLGDKQWTWMISGKDKHIIVANAMELVSQALAKHCLVKPDAPSMIWLKLEVNNVKARRDLARLLRFLNKLNIVQQADLAQVTGDSVEVSLQIKGTMALFQQNASIGQHLILKSQDEANNKLIYEWVR